MFNIITKAKDEISKRFEGNKYSNKINEVVEKNILSISDFFIKSIKHTNSSKY